MRNALTHLVHPKRFRSKRAFSLIEMFVSLGLLAVISVSVMQLLRSAIEQTQNTRMRIHQATVLNTFITFFKADANNATRIAWDQVDHKWIAFENKKTVIRYSLKPQTAFSNRNVFVREALIKTAPLPNIMIPNPLIPSTYELPTTYDPPDVPMTNFMPAEYASHIKFMCNDPCFDFQAGFRVQWNEPQVETVSTNPYDSLVSIVFGEMGHRHPAVLVFNTLTTPPFPIL